MADRDPQPDARDDGTPAAASPGPAGRSSDQDAVPQGSVYDWFVRGTALLHGGNPAAAVQLLARAASAEPDSRSVREALASMSSARPKSHGPGPSPAACRSAWCRRYVA